MRILLLLYRAGFRSEQARFLKETLRKTPSMLLGRAQSGGSNPTTASTLYVTTG